MSPDVLERVEALFAPDGALADELSRLVGSRLADHARSLPPPNTLEVADVARWFGDSRLPEAPIPPAEYLEGLFDGVVPHVVRTEAPRFIGHMTSALPAFVGPLDRVIDALNQNVVKLETSNALTFLERQSLAMLHRLVFARDASFYERHALDAESTLGMVLSGGTLANLVALWWARNRRLASAEGLAGVEEDGLAAALLARGLRGCVVIGSELMHYSFDKAVDVLGLGSRALWRLPVGVDGRLDPAEVAAALDRCEEERLLPLAVVGVAGTTETGSVDPLSALAALTRERGVPFHVDAAWGGPTLFSKSHRHRLAGIEEADTVTFDGHKQLYLPMGIGMLLFREPDAAKRLERVAQYIVRPGSPDLGRRSLEGSRPAMSLFLHGGLHLLGREGYGLLVDRGVARCRYMAEQIRAREELELLAEPELNILVYRYLPKRHRPLAPGASHPAEVREDIDAVNETLQKALWARGRGFVSRTRLGHTHRGKPSVVALRAVLANPRTTEADIDAVLDEQIKLGAELSS